MSNGVSLIEYLKKKYPTIECFLSQNLSLDSRSNFMLFLENTVIQEKTEENKIEFPRQLIDTTSYLDFIDSTVSFLVSRRVPNVLIKGYIDPSANAALSYKTINQHVNFQMNHIKGHNWNLLYNQIGSRGFFDLILSNNGYVKSDNEIYVQLFGTESIYKQKNTNEFNKNSILYKKSNIFNEINLLNKNSLVLAQEIFLIPPSKNIPKKFRNIKRLLEKAVSNERICNYLLIYHNIIGHSKLIRKSNFDNTTSISKVVIFCLTIIGKIFPFAIWGSCKNKTNIFQKIVDFIKSGTKDLFPVNDLLLGIKLTEIKWLGKSNTITSIQDLQLRKKLFSKFIEWILSDFVCKLIRKFWYAVESSTPELGQESGGLLYFPQSVWEALTKEWFSNYKNIYLEDPKVSTISVKESNWYNYGRLRIIPKANDFRVLCIPCKENITDQSENKANNRFEYLNYFNSYIRPIKEILLLKMKEFYEFNHGKNFPICHSIKDVTDTILSFKKKVSLNNKSEIPKIYSLKFDMKHCYDLLNQEKIMECLSEIFENDVNQKCYFVRQYVESSYGLIKRIHSLVKDDSTLEEFNILNNSSNNAFSKNSYITDKVKTIKLSKADIFDVVKNQIFSSQIILKEKPLILSKRKKGIFQGFPLSATLCEIVYNALVAHEFVFIRKFPESSILIRLADDFLVLSTSKQCIEMVDKVINGPILHKYGAFVNHHKLSYLDSSTEHTSLKFIGININIKNLTIEPDILSLGQTFLKKYTSFKGLFGYLQWYYKSRIKSYHLNQDLSTIESLVSYIDIILSKVLASVKSKSKKILKRERLNQSKFKNFLLYLVSETLLQFYFINGNNCNIHILYNAVRETIIKNLTNCVSFEETLCWIIRVL